MAFISISLFKHWKYNIQAGRGVVKGVEGGFSENRAKCEKRNSTFFTQKANRFLPLKIVICKSGL